MRISVPLLSIAGTVAGTAAAVVAYQSAAAGGATPTRPAADRVDSRVVTTTRWQPCEHGWKRVAQACVKVKEHVVVVHDLPARAAEPAQSAGVRSSSDGPALGDDAAEDQGDDAKEATEPADDDDAVEQSDEGSDDGAEGVEESDHEDVGGDD